MRQDENLKIWHQKSIVPDANCKENKNEMNVHTYAGIPISELQLKLGHLKEKNKRKLYAILNSHKDVFAKDWYNVGGIKGYTAAIKLNENKYVYKKPYRCSFPDQEI